MLRRNELYRECKLDVAVDGDALTGFYIAAQTIQLAAIGGARNVPMPIARFRDASAAFADGSIGFALRLTNTKASQASLAHWFTKPCGKTRATRESLATTCRLQLT